MRDYSDAPRTCLVPDASADTSRRRLAGAARTLSRGERRTFGGRAGHRGRRRQPCRPRKISPELRKRWSFAKTLARFSRTSLDASGGIELRPTTAWCFASPSPGVSTRRTSLARRRTVHLSASRCARPPSSSSAASSHPPRRAAASGEAPPPGQAPLGDERRRAVLGHEQVAREPSPSPRLKHNPDREGWLEDSSNCRFSIGTAHRAALRNSLSVSGVETGSDLTMTLYRSDTSPPPFTPVSTWSDNYDVARSRRAQLIFGHGGLGTIWVAEVLADSSRVLDARLDATAVWRALRVQSGSQRLRDAVHEHADILQQLGWQWVIFTEPGEPGPEYVHLAGAPIQARRADDP
jgi:hypothetical protein